MSAASADHAAWAALASAPGEVWEPSSVGDALTEFSQPVPKMGWVCMMEPIWNGFRA